MSKYEKLKVKYDNLIRETLDSNKRILIESFVDYYGEEYRNIIEKRYNEIIFIYYVDWETIDLVVENFIPKVENKDKYADFINLSNSRKTPKINFEGIFKAINKKCKLPNNLIGTTNPSILNNIYINNYLFKKLKSPCPSCKSWVSIGHTNRIISFQILSLSESTIIHEINHAITMDIMALITEENRPMGAIHKSGLSIEISHKNNIAKITEELVNEKAGREITKIFKQRGGDLSSFCFNISLSYVYESNLYLVDEFYDKFKKYIKIARISDNKNALVERIGKSNYENYLSLVNYFYTEDITTIDKNKEENEKRIKIIIDEMRGVEKISHDLSQQELNDTYKYLESKGFKTKILKKY